MKKYTLTSKFLLFVLLSGLLSTPAISEENEDNFFRLDGRIVVLHNEVYVRTRIYKEDWTTGLITPSITTEVKMSLLEFLKNNKITKNDLQMYMEKKYFLIELFEVTL